MEFQDQREEVAYFMKRLYNQKLTTTSGGNISLRIDNNNILVTPSQIDKGRLTGDQIGITNLDGKYKTPGLQFSMETGMHLAIYRKKKDINAIVHAHPVFSTSFAVMNKQINCKLTGEARAVIGIPVVAPYALMGSKRLADSVATAITKSNVVLMRNHGIITIGENLLQAFDRIEVLEAAAKITLITELMDDCNEIPKDQLKKIDDLFS